MPNPSANLRFIAAHGGDTSDVLSNRSTPRVHQGLDAPASSEAVAVSVIIPVYNGAATLGRCLNALAGQAVPHPAYELIVVDDGSSDASAEIASGHDCRLVSLPRRSGPAAARNRGASVARGDILLFIDADCEASPGWMSPMLAPFQDPAVSGVYGAYRTRQAGLVPRFVQAEFEARYQRLSRYEVIDFSAAHSFGIRRPVFVDLGGFDAELYGNEDVDLAYRLSRRGGRLVFAPRAIVYHQHPAALYDYLRTKASRGYWRCIVYARHPHKAMRDSYTPWLLKLQVVAIVAALIAALGALRWPVLLLLLPALLAALLLTSLPFTLFVWRTQPSLTWIVPILSLVRSAALSIGVLAALPAVALAYLRRLTRRPPSAT